MGPTVEVHSAERLGFSSFNRVYRLSFVDRDSLVLRIAPPEQTGFASEALLMRNEHAAGPWFAFLGDLVPKTIECDWTHAVIDADWMLQSIVPGQAAAGSLGLARFPRDTWRTYYRQLGSISRRIHAVSGTFFGRHVGEHFCRFDDYLEHELEQYAVDFSRVGVRRGAIDVARQWFARNKTVFDSVEEPSLLSGDLWIVNTLVEERQGAPVITGVLDFDRSSWGDPAYDWTVRMAQRKQDERTAFWGSDGYGALPDPDGTLAQRLRFYEVIHLASVLPERLRLGKQDPKAFSAQLAGVVAQLS